MLIMLHSISLSLLTRNKASVRCGWVLYFTRFVGMREDNLWLSAIECLANKQGGKRKRRAGYLVTFFCTITL